MGESIKCDLCGKPATVHLTQIINKQIQKVDLCESCAQQKGVTDPEGFSLADMLTKSTPEEALELVGDEASTGLRCEHCGFTAQKFKKIGRLGCPVCYDNLMEMVTPMLEGMHKGTRHVGKIPHKVVRRLEFKQRLKQLETQLHTAIEEERYEDAARFRDEIARLQNERALEHQFPVHDD